MADFTQWLISHGVSLQILEMMIFVPILATLVSLVRYILGMKTFGIYAPIILAIAFKFTGLAYGLILATIVVVSTLVTYSALRKVRMHYLTRITINYVILSIFVTLGIVGIDSLNLGFEKFYLINPLALVSIAALSDFFVKMYVKKSLAITIRTLIETILVSVIGWFLITSRPLTQAMVENLWIVPTLILVNLLIGQYKGLRLKDIFRFRSAVADVPNRSK